MIYKVIMFKRGYVLRDPLKCRTMRTEDSLKSIIIFCRIFFRYSVCLCSPLEV